MKKLLILAGLTGSGKTVIAEQLAKSLNTQIIVGDSLQMYKNWPISSNWPSNHKQYLLIGKFDSLHHSVSSVDYKSIVLKELQSIDKPFIEGGCCFYLNYLLNSKKEQFEQSQIDQADEKAKELLQKTRDPQELLVSYCKSYDGSINSQDRYRLIKALRYAILTDGKQVTTPFGIDEKTIAEQYDVRGFFLTTSQDIIQQKIYKRYIYMIENGMLEEFYQFYKKNEKSSDQVTTPIGYDQFEILLGSYKNITLGKYVSQAKVEKIKKEKLRKFIQSFYVQSRQYSAYQRKYFRNNLPEFLWVDNQTMSVGQFIEQNYQCDRKEFEDRVNSELNTKLKQQRSTTKFGKMADPLPPTTIENIVFDKMEQFLSL